jgi:molybdopterin biosynthesis enzyme MoaB
MTATVLPFPLARRRDMITRQSRYASELSPDSAERFIRQQLKIQGDRMGRRGVPDDQIARELQSMEAAIRHELQASVSTGGT